MFWIALIVAVFAVVMWRQRKPTVNEYPQEDRLNLPPERKAPLEPLPKGAMEGEPPVYVLPGPIYYFYGRFVSAAQQENTGGNTKRSGTLFLNDDNGSIPISRKAFAAQLKVVKDEVKPKLAAAKRLIRLGETTAWGSPKRASLEREIDELILHLRAIETATEKLLERVDDYSNAETTNYDRVEMIYTEVADYVHELEFVKVSWEEDERDLE